MTARASSPETEAGNGGLRFEAYLPPNLALWVLDMVERGIFTDPSEAVFVILGSTKTWSRTPIWGSVAAEPKLHFGAILLQKGVDPENAAVPEARSYPNGTEKVFHANVPQGFTSMGL